MNITTATNTKTACPITDYLNTIRCLLLARKPPRFSNPCRKLLDILTTVFSIEGFAGDLKHLDSVDSLLDDIKQGDCKYRLVYMEEGDSDFLITYLTILSKLSPSYLLAIDIYSILFRFRLHVGFSTLNLPTVPYKFNGVFTEDLLRDIEGTTKYRNLTPSSNNKNFFLLHTDLHSKVLNHLNKSFQKEQAYLGRLGATDEIISFVTGASLVGDTVFSSEGNVVNSDSYLKDILTGKLNKRNIRYLIDYLQEHGGVNSCSWSAIISLARVGGKLQTKSCMDMSVLEFFIMYNRSVRLYLNKLNKQDISNE